MIPEWFIVIPWYSKYYINLEGQVYSIFSKRLLKPKENKKRWWYNYISIQEEWVKVKNWLVHRLVMHTFTWIKEWLEINHIDWNKSNNSLSNLEWVTSSENKLHKYRVLWIRHTQKQRETSKKNWEKSWFKVIRILWDETITYNSCDNAWLFNNVSWVTIWNWCKWLFKDKRWYSWKYFS